MRAFSLGGDASFAYGWAVRAREHDSGATASVDMPSGPSGGADPSTSDAPQARGPTGVSVPLERFEARSERRRKAAAGRRRRRRGLLIGIPLLGVLAWAVISYGSWMLKPTSMSFGARSVEWVRTETPFGNAIVDDIEHVYYTANAPKPGSTA